MAETWAASTVIEHHKKEPKPKEDISGYATSLFGLISRTGKAGRSFTLLLPCIRVLSMIL